MFEITDMANKHLYSLPKILDRSFICLKLDAYKIDKLSYSKDSRSGLIAMTVKLLLRCRQSLTQLYMA